MFKKYKLFTIRTKQHGATQKHGVSHPRKANPVFSQSALQIKSILSFKRTRLAM